MTRLQFRKGNFPPRNPLKSHKTGKESRKRRRADLPSPVLTGRGRGWGLFGPVDEALEVSGSGARPPAPEGNFPPRNPLKSHKTGKESRKRRPRGSPLPVLSPGQAWGGEQRAPLTGCPS